MSQDPGKEPKWKRGLNAVSEVAKRHQDQMRKIKSNFTFKGSLTQMSENANQGWEMLRKGVNEDLTEDKLYGRIRKQNSLYWLRFKIYLLNLKRDFYTEHFLKLRSCMFLGSCMALSRVVAYNKNIGAAFIGVVGYGIFSYYLLPELWFDDVVSNIDSLRSPSPTQNRWLRRMGTADSSEPEGRRQIAKTPKEKHIEVVEEIINENKFKKNE